MAMQDTVIQRAGAWIARLSERERRLVFVTALVACVLVLGIGFSLVSGALKKREKRIALRRDEIVQLEALRGRYTEAVQQEEQSKNRIANNTGSLFTILQNAASEVGIALSDLNERRIPVKDNADVTEASVDLTLKEITIDKLNTLLEKIEGARGDGVVKVSKLKVKTRFDNPEMLEASMTVSTWKSTSPGGTPGAETK